MKKIINGKKYDTDTAKFLAKWENKYPVNDFRYCEESLYRKRNGEFFLYGFGGAMTRYKVMESSNTWTSGEKISPLTEKQARKWCESNLEAEDYEAIFGTVNE